MEHRAVGRRAPGSDGAARHPETLAAADPITSTDRRC
jgi:hypothetical protein